MTGSFPFPKPGIESFRDSVCAWSITTKHKNTQTDVFFRDNISSNYKIVHEIRTDKYTDLGRKKCQFVLFNIEANVKDSYLVITKIALRWRARLFRLKLLCSYRLGINPVKIQIRTVSHFLHRGRRSK